eukprot:m.37217 g.37217  ORF g.37217 m.37217 type:complete len:115 (-) comp44952_c0_seq2:106-450(-)
MMIQNLLDRGCPLLGISDCPSLSAQEQRLRKCGFEHSFAIDMSTAYRSLPHEDVRRIEKIEWLDELEEWQLFGAHYCIACGCRDSLGLGLAGISLVPAQGLLPPPHAPFPFAID